MSERVWVVTGTSSGLGLATALHALRQGDKVIATVRSLAKFPQILKDAGAHPLVLSLESSDDIIQSAAEESLKVYGHVNVLINNAGTMAGGYGPVEELSMEELRRHFQVNYFGQIAFTRPFITHFRTRGSGCIINVSTMISLGSYPSCSPYGGAKAALDAAADALRAELRPFNIRVYTILPGVFPSNIQNSAAAHAKDLDNRGDAAMEALSKVYTDPSQGYDAVNVFPRSKGGDPEMFAQRIHEIATETGLAKQVMGNYTDHPTWTRIPMGSDATRHIQDKGAEIAQNAKAYETLSRSTDSPAAETAKATSGPPPMGQRLRKLLRRYW